MCNSKPRPMRYALMLLSLLILLAACNSKTTRTPTRPVEQTPTIACDDDQPIPSLGAYPLLPSGASQQPVDFEQALQVITTLRSYSAAQSRAYQGAVAVIVPLKSSLRFTRRCLDDYRRRGVIH